MRDWPFAHPFDWYRDRALACETASDEWYALVNVLRWAAGLSPVGHGQTFDFWLALGSVKRFNAAWHGKAN